MDTLLPGITASGAHQPPDGQRAVRHGPERPSGAVRARQRVVLAVLAADHAGAAGAVPAAGDRPARVRRHRPRTGGRDPRAEGLRGRPGRRDRRARPGLGAPGRLEHGRRGGPAVPGRPAGHAPGRVADAGRSGLPVRVRRDQGRGRHAVRPEGRRLRRRRAPTRSSWSGWPAEDRSRRRALLRRGRYCWRTTSSRRTYPSTWTSSWSPCCPPGSGDDYYPGDSRPSPPGRASRPATAACSTPWRPPISGSPTCPGCGPSRRCCGCAARTT